MALKLPAFTRARSNSIWAHSCLCWDLQFNLWQVLLQYLTKSQPSHRCIFEAILPHLSGMYILYSKMCPSLCVCSNIRTMTNHNTLLWLGHRWHPKPKWRSPTFFLKVLILDGLLHCSHKLFADDNTIGVHRMKPTNCSYKHCEHRAQSTNSIRQYLALELQLQCKGPAHSLQASQGWKIQTPNIFGCHIPWGGDHLVAARWWHMNHIYCDQR